MKLIRRCSFPALLLIGALSSTIGAQKPAASPVPQGSPEISRENREQAYAKLMEGQRNLLRSNPRRYPTTAAESIRNAKLAFQRAVELDPALSEGYTALAEITLNTPPNDVDGAIGLATIATKIEPNNFGAHKILAWLFTFKSRFGSGTLDQPSATKAINEWKEVGRLDPRNAEAWAFLSEFYSLAGKSGEQIEALKKWVGSAPPVDPQFYRQAMGGRADLTPEAASMKLGSALVAAGRGDEAVEVLSALVADNPDDADAVDLLREAIEIAGPKAAGQAIESLVQAVYALPGNTTLVSLLSQVYIRSGRSDDAVKVLRDAVQRIEKTDRIASSLLEVQLGDLYGSNDKATEAIAAYEKAFTIRGIKDNQAVADADHDFVLQIFEKMIKTYKAADRPTDARAVIERARKLLGKSDLFADRQMIEFDRESGHRPEALALVRTLRAKNQNDYGLLRLEASVLADSGMVDQGVALVRGLIKKSGQEGPAGGGGLGESDPAASLPVLYDDFTNLLFISHLYMQAGRGTDAADAANQAYAAAGSEERRQIAKMSLASAQQMNGDFATAEATLRAILKQTPRNPIALNNLGYFLLERNERPDEALVLIQKALKIDPTNPSYLDSLGWAQFVLGNLDEAERDLRTAARLDISSATIHEHLGDVYGKQGRLEQARSAWQRALILATTSADVNRLKSKLQK